MHSPLITIHALNKNYMRDEVSINILKNISFCIDTGECVAIVGASGSGKSTLMNILGLLDKANQGEYWLNGSNIMQLNDDELAVLRNEYIGFVFQQFYLLPRFTIYQNVALPLVYRSLLSSEIEVLVLNALAQVGMEKYKAYYPLQLSGGQQQRVAIARALVGDPKLILADEPTGALDSRTGTEIMHLFSSLHREGRTILMITHDELIASQCQRRLSISDGQIVSDESNSKRYEC